MNQFERLATAILTCGACLLASRADAAFHLVKVSEVFTGTSAAPNAQYVELTMYAAGQNFVGTHAVKVFNASGTEVGSFTFGSSLANGTNQAKILLATTEAEALFNITADLTMTAAIPAGGGKVCWDALDCVAFGNYTALPDATVGTPITSIPLGQSAQRRLDIAGGATVLDAADDTNDSKNDFTLGVPSPTNNAGVTGTLPVDAGTPDSGSSDSGSTDSGSDAGPADSGGVDASGDATADAAGDGAAGTAGTGASAGAAGNGGSGGTGGFATGGSSSGGSPGSGGATGGFAGFGGVFDAGLGGASEKPKKSDEESGCSCRTTGGPTDSSLVWLSGLLGLWLVRRRTRLG